MITPFKTSLQGYTSRSAPGVGIHSIFGISFAFRENQGAIGLRSSCINDGVICFPVNDPGLYENIMFIHLLIKFNLFFWILLQPSSFHCFHYWEANYPKCTTVALWDWKDKYLIQSYSFLFICSEVYKREKERKNEHQKPWQHLQWQNYAKYVYIHKCTHTNTSLIHSHPYPPPPVRLVVTKQLMLMASAQEQWYHAFDQHSVWSWSWPTAIRTSNRHRNDTHRQTHHLRDAIGTTFSILYWLQL